ncbi:MAG: hypothetical protein BGO29_04545 [Bacteroidales bacterium 36-12]|nr:MAG: hypothetical protein BGO29_04545 [Bacteroidales bacterium 36-12]
MAKMRNENNIILYTGLATLSLLMFRNKNRDNAGIGIPTVPFSKEFYESMKFFEEAAKEITYGVTYEKEDKELWTKGYYYKNGKVNELFRAFLAGYAFGITV